MSLPEVQSALEKIGTAAMEEAGPLMESEEVGQAYGDIEETLGALESAVEDGVEVTGGEEYLLEDEQQIEDDWENDTQALEADMA